MIFGTGSSAVGSLIYGLHFIFEFWVIIQLNLPFYFVIFHFLGLIIGGFIVIKLLFNSNHFRVYLISGGSFVALLIGLLSINQVWLGWLVPLCLFGLGLCIGINYGSFVPMLADVLEYRRFIGRFYSLSFLLYFLLIAVHAVMSFYILSWLFPIYFLILFLVNLVVAVYARSEIREPPQKRLNLGYYFRQREYLPQISLAFFVGFFTTNTYYITVLILESEGALANPNNLYLFVIILFLAATIVTPFVGVMLDSIGRRFTILLGISIQALAFLLLGFLDINLTALLYIFPIILGVGFAMITVGAYLSFAELPKLEYLRNSSSILACWFVGLGCIGGVIIGEVFRGVILIEPAYLTVMLLFIFVLATLSISQLKETLLSKDELEWRACVQHLFVINENGICLLEHPFIDQDLIDRDLISGALTGVIALVQEVTKSAEKLEVLSQKDSKLILKHGAHTITALLSTKDLKILHKKLEDFVGEFEDIFHDFLEPWTGNIAIFKPADRLILRYFK